MLINMTKLFLRAWLAAEIQLLARRIFAVSETRMEQNARPPLCCQHR